MQKEKTAQKKLRNHAGTQENILRTILGLCIELNSDMIFMEAEKGRFQKRYPENNNIKILDIKRKKLQF